MFGINDSNQNVNSPGDAAPSVPVAPAPEVVHPVGEPAAAARPEPPSAPAISKAEPAFTDTPPAAAPAPMPMPMTLPTPPVQDDGLIGLKEQALNNLAPLVSHLDQTPEEKFKTTMMLIQASDNPHLIKDAYEAANKITDEKTRAQALLDVINEINYFTQKDAEKKV